MTTLDARQKILAANAAAADGLRSRFAAQGTLVVNLISSPGSGKTTLLEATARRLAGEIRMAAIVGDIATERDADRLRRAGLPAHQIVTGGSCHLDARMVENAMVEPLRNGARYEDLDLLFVENVGNLVCPANYDLGEHFKVVLLSVAEGGDKPFKYPGIFSKADVALITKIDLLPYLPFDLHAVRDEIAVLRPTGTTIPLSSTTGEGMDSWCGLLRERIARCKSAMNR
ncbi:MAG: hydrogenase nickel incorporation protein HypB [Planctomycetota bacterium]